MEVILKEDVAKLGSRGDVVKVAEGYGRNYLLPRKLAIEASTGNKAVIEQMKSAAVRRALPKKRLERKRWLSSSTASLCRSNAEPEKRSSSSAPLPLATSRTH